MASHPSSLKAINGFVGALYWQPKKGYFVLAHRGTNPLSLGADWTDFKGIFEGSYVHQVNSATTFSHIVVKALREWSSKNEVSMPVLSFTGHSLGGWLAQVTTFTTKYLDRSGAYFKKRATFPYHPHTVVWDSPGCKTMLLQLKKDFDLRYKHRAKLSKLSLGVLDIRSYLSAPNQINTCNMHTGVIYRLFPRLTKQDPEATEHLLSRLVATIQTFFDSCLYTLKTHSLDTLLAAYLKENGNPNEEKLKKVIDWPIRSGI